MTANPNWKKGGTSPNPLGRPPGILDKRQKMQRALGESADAVIAMVQSKALEGDMQAANIIISRLVPVIKAEGALVKFAFDAGLPLAQQVEQITQAIADGHISADVARQVVDVIDRLAGIRQVDDLAIRIAALEAKG